MDHEDDDVLWSAAAVTVTLVSVCAAELAMQKEKRKVWVKRMFQRRQSKGLDLGLAHKVLVLIVVLSQKTS